MSSGVMTRRRAAALAEAAAAAAGDDANAQSRNGAAAGEAAPAPSAKRPQAALEVDGAGVAAPVLGLDPPLVLPSHTAFRALVALPLLSWWAAIAAGVVQHEGLPPGVKRVYHVMTWFDSGLLRPYGPLLPFVVLAARAAAVALAGGSGGARRATLAGACLRVYAAIAAARLALYLGHVAALDGAALTGHLVSDHIFLAASMVACLQAELLCAASDVVRLMRRVSAAAAPPPVSAGEVGLATVVLAAALLHLLTSADMYFTAKFFHPPRESAVTALAALLVFQLPVLLWLSRARAGHAAALRASAARVAFT